jgi:uncharacterized protein DUF4037
VNGIEIAERYYRDEVAPQLKNRRHAAALLGAGSEVLGYDDGVSPDHDFGKRVQIFYPDRDTAGEFFRAQLGFDPAEPVSVEDWLLTPTQIFASLTRGAVFHDPGAELHNRRAALAWYPDDVWRYALAAGWLKVSQEEAFVGRTGGTGDDLGSRVLAARLVRELMRLAFLVERRWAPYGKWFGRAFGELESAAELKPLLDGALGAADWRERERMVAGAASVLARRTNGLMLAGPVDPAPRQFYERDITVLGAERFTVALAEEITDPVLRGLVDRLGLRHGHIPRLPGTVDQAVDSTDALAIPERFRKAAPLLGIDLHVVGREAV